MTSRTWYFSGGDAGNYIITSMQALVGEGLASASHLLVSPTPPAAGPVAKFALHGVVRNERYQTQREKGDLVSVQSAIGRPPCVRGALIPIQKSAAWWNLSQDERRAIFEERSAHIAVGRRALPAVARRLHHCRDLEIPGEFDFLTWFDFAPEDEPIFDDLLAALRATEEWRYVSREVEIRLTRLVE
jgi:hypothetical protein